MRRGLKHFVVFTAMLATLISCRRQTRVQLLVHSESPPTRAESVVPQITRLSSGKALLSWERPLSGGGYSFEMAVKNGSRWSDVHMIAEGPKLSMFTTDLPAVATLAGTKLLAYWKVKDEGGSDPYATTIKMAISDDDGRTMGADSHALWQ